MGSAESVSSKSALHFALLDSRIVLLSGFWALARILSSPLDGIARFGMPSQVFA
jgi:hypothetical protein